MSDPLDILIVEDGPTAVARVEDELRAGGLPFQSRVVGNRADYLAALDAACPDLVLSNDCVDGFDCLDALGVLVARCPAVPFIVVTGSISEEAAGTCIKAGAADYVPRDHLGRLVPAVRAALERRLLVEAGRDAERRTVEAQERAQATIDALRIRICVLDDRGTVVAVNRACREPTGPPAGPGGDIVEGANYLEACESARGQGAADVRAFSLGLRSLLAGHQDTVDLEYSCPRPHGDRCFVARATSFETQGVRQVVVAHEDVTSRKRQEEVLLRTEQQLMLAQKMEAIGRLAGGVAHDFNNILSVIRGQAERALHALASDDPNHDRLAQILHSADDAARLTRQLLAFGRQQILEPRVLRLDSVVADAREMLERTIGEDVAVHVAVPSELGHVRADPGQIGQVLLNLAVNARDAMPQGGQLTIELADVVLDDTYAGLHPPCVPGAYVLLAVTDSGCGMDEETRSRVFEPFFTTKPEGKGTGLGLATAYGIVKQSGGFIWVYSEPGRGTAFKVYLPRVADPVDAVVHPPPTPAAKPAHHDARLLVVEDDDDVRSLIAEVLAEQGYEVATAATPAEALAKLESSPAPVDVLLTDVIMPGMSGRTLASRVAAIRPGLRVMYLSGYAGEAVVRQGGLARDDHFLQKPFSEADLLRSVAETLDAPVPETT